MIPAYLHFRQPPGWQRAQQDASTDPTALPAADVFDTRLSRGDRAGDHDDATCVTLGTAYYVIPGNQGSPAVMRRVCQEIAADLKKDGVEGVLLVAT